MMRVRHQVQPTRPTRRSKTVPRGPLRTLTVLVGATALVVGTLMFLYAELHPPKTFLDQSRLGTRSVLEEPHLVASGLEEIGGVGKGGVEEAVNEGSGKNLPRCFSSPQADPKEGAWRKLPGGVDESPASNDDWELPANGTKIFARLNICRQNWQQGGVATPQPYWIWEPVNCKLEVVTESSLCHVMKGRKGLLLVGDSLTRLLTTTLAAILRADLVTASGYPTLNNADGIDEWSACMGELVLRFVRNDYLYVGTTPLDGNTCFNQAGEKAECFVFADDAMLAQFDTLVVNSGAHRRTDEEFAPTMSTAAEVLTSSMKRIHGDDALLVVRNTVPGHWNCSERQLDGPIDAETAISLVEGAPAQYSWNHFHAQNAILEDAFSVDLGWRLLDAYSPTLLRSDMHLGETGKRVPDCLHYCLPGPADHWATLLYNILLAG